MSRGVVAGFGGDVMALPSRIAVNFDHRLARRTFVMEIRSGLGSPLVLVLLIAVTLNLTTSPRGHTSKQEERPIRLLPSPHHRDGLRCMMRLLAALGGLRRHIVSIVPTVRAVQQAARLVDDYERDQNLDQLNTAVDILRGAPGPTLPPGAEDSNRASLLAVLSQALTARFEAVGEPADLDEAVRAGRDAVAASRPGERRHFMIQSILGVALAMQFERNGEPADLDDEAITGNRRPPPRPSTP
jgi:hypothetical protein